MSAGLGSAGLGEMVESLLKERMVSREASFHVRDFFGRLRHGRSVLRGRWSVLPSVLGRPLVGVRWIEGGRSRLVLDVLEGSSTSVMLLEVVFWLVVWSVLGAGSSNVRKLELGSSRLGDGVLSESSTSAVVLEVVCWLVVWSRDGACSWGASWTELGSSRLDLGLVDESSTSVTMMIWAPFCLVSSTLWGGWVPVMVAILVGLRCARCIFTRAMSWAVGGIVATLDRRTSRVAGTVSISCALGMWLLLGR